MICQRLECPNAIIPPRWKYCCAECSTIANREAEAKRKDKAKRYAKTMRRTKPAMRRCLGKLFDGTFCNKMFKSQDASNRFCPACLARRGDAPRTRVQRITADIDASEAEPE